MTLCATSGSLLGSDSGVSEEVRTPVAKRGRIGPLSLTDGVALSAGASTDTTFSSSPVPSPVRAASVSAGTMVNGMLSLVDGTSTQVTDLSDEVAEVREEPMEEAIDESTWVPGASVATGAPREQV